ncbi:MAG: type I-U CRISPR-associated protein Cas5/Cas6 [Planctomycetota bacterium]|nr:MAG: type I-U CRISPR-associated protein Cas5/Cas6 [Planctomycetota bacterium]
MLTLRIRFPAGRYHATPLGYHVNEGLIEWPPSPWRLLRALLACGYCTLAWRQPPAVAVSLLRRLAAEPPEFLLPKGALGHSRHYMPTARFDKGVEARTLVFDSFVDVGEGALLIRWPFELPEDELHLLTQLCEHLGYLGRSESWVEAELLGKEHPLCHEDWRGESGHCAPSDPGDLPAEHEIVQLLAPMKPGDFDAWLEAARDHALAQLPLPEGKRPSAALLKKREKALADLPGSFELALQAETEQWRKAGWNRPPGSQQLRYSRPYGRLAISPIRRVRHEEVAPVEAVLLSLRTPNGRRGGLPGIARTLPQAELLHRAVIAQRARGQRVRCPELIGKGEDGQPLSGHRHLHVLPLDLDADGRLEHILLYAPMGFGPEAQDAIDALKRTWMKGGAGELSVARAGRGALADLRRLGPPWSEAIARLLGAVEGAHKWRSATPFVPPRYLKRSGRNTLERQVLAELESRGLPVAGIEVLPWDRVAQGWRHFVRRRGGRAAQPPMDCGFALELDFEEPISGPLCLGYGAHFGLGRFDSC